MAEKNDKPVDGAAQSAAASPVDMSVFLAAQQRREETELTLRQEDLDLRRREIDLREREAAIRERELEMAKPQRSDADAARFQQLDDIRRQHLADDAARLQLGTTRVVALTSFTMMGVDDTGATRSQVVRSGDELEFPVFDLPGYEGKVRLKDLDLLPDEGGVTIKRG